MTPRKKTLLLRKSLLLAGSLLQVHVKKLQNMLRKEVKVFHTADLLNDSVSWKLSVNSFQPKCLIIPDNAFRTKC